MTNSMSFAAAVVAATLLAAPAHSAELEASTLDAWNQYIRSSTMRPETPVNTSESFLWIDENADRRARIQQGEILVAPAIGRGTQSVPDGLIHDWIGGVFIPGATVKDLRTVLADYDSYKKVYKPAVTDSRALSSDKPDLEFSMVWKRHVMFVTSAMQARYLAHETSIDPTRGYTIVDAIQIQQIEDYGHPNEHLLPPDTGNGFIWRVRTVVKYEQRDGGVYLQLEAMALTRGIPSSVEWMVQRVVNRLSIDSLTATLRQTRDAVDERAAANRNDDASQRPTSVALMLGPR